MIIKIKEMRSDKISKNKLNLLITNILKNNANK